MPHLVPIIARIDLLILCPSARLICADSFKVGVIFAGVMLLLLIAVTVTGWVFMRKDGSTKEEFPAVLASSESGSVNKDVRKH